MAVVLLMAAAWTVGPALAEKTKTVIPLSSVPEHDNLFAIVVGIGAYPEASGLAPLKYAASDAEKVGKELGRLGYAPPIVLKDGDGSRAIIRRSLKQLKDRIQGKSATVVFFFSGHGFQLDGRNYLATFNVTSDDLREEGLDLQEVVHSIQTAGAARAILFIDACRNESAAKGTAASFGTSSPPDGVKILYSTKPGSFSFEDDRLEQGVFTHFLLQGLSSGGAVGLPITFGSVRDYVTTEMRRYVVRQGIVQIPYESGESSGDFPMGSAGLGAGTVPHPAESASRIENRAPERTTPPDSERAPQGYEWLKDHDLQIQFLHPMDFERKHASDSADIVLLAGRGRLTCEILVGGGPADPSLDHVLTALPRDFRIAEKKSGRDYFQVMGTTKSKTFAIKTIQYKGQQKTITIAYDTYGTDVWTQSAHRILESFSWLPAGE